MLSRALLCLTAGLLACGGPEPKPAPKLIKPTPTQEAPIPLDCPEGATAYREKARIFCAKEIALHGPYKGYASGQVVEEMTLVEGRREGAYKRHWPGGRPRQQGAYEEGLRAGRWMAWDAQGRPYAQADFQRGKLKRCVWGECESAFPPDVFCALSHINETLGAHSRGVEACFKEAVKRRSSAGGEVHIRWVVGLDGRPRNVQVSKSRLDRGMSACLKKELEAWRFPMPSGGACPVEHIFRFQQEF